MVWNNTKPKCLWAAMLITMVASYSLAIRCEDVCDYCSTTSIVCYSIRWPGLAEIVSVLPPYTECLTFIAAEYTEMYLDDCHFEHLTQLKILNITFGENSGIVYIGRSQRNVFASLSKLKILKIHLKVIFEYEPLDDLFRPLVHLEELDLSQTRQLNITNLRRALYGFSNSTRLETINLSNVQSEHKFPMYPTLNLTWFLEPLQNCPIRHLHLANNGFQEIYPGIIRYTPLLEYIDVSNNLLQTDVFHMPLMSPAFFQETLLHKGLQEIDYSYQPVIPVDQTRGLQGSNPRFPEQEKFTNRRRHLHSSTFQQRISLLVPDDVVSQNWSQCAEYFDNDPCDIFSPNCSDTRNHLRHDHSLFCELLYAFAGAFESGFYQGIPCSSLPSFDDIFQRNCVRCSVFPTTGSAKLLMLKALNSHEKKFSHTYTQTHPNVCFHQSNQLEYLDLSGNAYMVYMFNVLFADMNLSVTGLTHIKVLNASSIGITSVSSNMLLSFPNLQVMDMSRNEINFDKERPMSLTSNRDIQCLNFSHNLIHFVPQNLFSSLVSLQKLDLSHNRLHDFDFNVSGLILLVNLNLEYNKISEISEATRKQLIQLAEHIAPRVITVDLSNNQLACLCSSIPSLSFMSQSKPNNLVFENYDKYFCRNQGDDRVRLHNMNLHSLWFDCLGSGVYMGIGFACAAVVITIIMLLALFVYRKRWWFRYQYFLAHRVWKNYNKIATLDTPFEYDLFVSYNRCDYQWVDEILQPKLEDELGLRLCLHHRDFRLGEVITEQIIESIQSSKKTLFILSKSFLASTWCHFEIRMAQSRLFTTGKDVILLALLEPLPDRMVSKTLKGLLETRTYVEWTENDTYEQKLFWETLYESVKAPISQPFHLEDCVPPPGIQTEESRDPSSEAAAREREPLLASSRSELSESWHQVQVHA